MNIALQPPLSKLVLGLVCLVFLLNLFCGRVLLAQNAGVGSNGTPHITPSNLPGGEKGIAYTATLSATGLNNPSWSVASGSLPPGVGLSSKTGTISGTPAAAGQYNFTIQAVGKGKSNGGASVQQAYSVPVVTPVIINTISLSSGTVGTAYSQNLSASGGTQPYSWLLASGSLPPGLSLSASGTISGTPASAGQFSFTVQVADSSSPQMAAGQPYSMTVAPSVSPLTITTTSVPSGIVGTAYGPVTLAATGGTGSGFTWGASAGSISPLTLSSDGVISGTPTSTNPISFTSLVTDSGANTATQAFTIDVTSSTAACAPPDYCGYTGTEVIPYSGMVTSPPLLNTSFTDPAFNRKIWRITDTTTDNGKMMAPSWAAGAPAGVWNANQTLMILGNHTGGDDMFKVNLSDPANPSVLPFSCSYSATPNTCRTGGVIFPGSGLAGSVFANTQNYVTYGWSQNSTDGNGALVKVDWSATVSSNGSTAPTRTVMFNPYASGKCMSGLTYPGFSSRIIIDSTDTYFWGQSSDNKHFIVYKAGAADCALFDTSGATTWTKSGDTVWSGANGNFTFRDQNNNIISYPGVCQIHGYYYEPSINGVWISPSAGSCGLAMGGWGLNLSTLTAYSCDANVTTGCSGHGYGLANVNSGSQVGTGIMAYHDSYQMSFWYMPHGTLPLPAAAKWGHTVSFDQTTGASIDQHSSMSLASNAGFPTWGVSGFFQDGAGAAYEVPQTTAPPVLSFGEDEILVWRFNDASDANDPIYRFVHHYSLAGNYVALQYGFGVLTALSPNSCWVAFSSNWMGQLGDYSQTPKTTLCTSADPQNCRYDTFLVYLCGGSGT